MTKLWVERTGTRRYTGRSSRGAEVLVGSEDVQGVFTPGELMKIALAACSGMSSDFPLARRLFVVPAWGEMGVGFLLVVLGLLFALHHFRKLGARRPTG